MVDKHSLSKIGIGAWGLGGFATNDPNNSDKRQTDAVAYAIQKGINFVEINFWNSQGHSIDILSHAIKKSDVPREKLFFVQAIYDYIPIIR